MTTIRIGSQISMWRSPWRGVATVTSDIGRLRQRVLTAGADAGERRIARHRLHDAPAPLAFHAVGALDGDAGCAAGGRAQLDLRYDEQHRQVSPIPLQEHPIVL